MSLTSIDLYETDGLLLFNSKSIIFQATDLERVIEKAENIFNFYLDFNWEFRSSKWRGVSPLPSLGTVLDSLPSHGSSYLLLLSC